MGRRASDVSVVFPLLQNCFLVKRESSRIQMSTSPYNLTNLNTFKHCGISNGKAADISAVENGVVLSIKSRGTRKAHFNKSPVKIDKKTKCARDFSRDFRRVAKCVKNTVGGYYRPDLVGPALARWSKLHKSLKVIKAKKGAAAK